MSPPASSTPASSADSGHRSAFAQPRFRRYFSAMILSTLGSWVLRFLLGWSAWEATGSAFWVGTIASLMLAPTFLLSPLFGITADRINPRNGLQVTLGLLCVVGLVGATLQLTGGLELRILLLLAFLFGAVAAAHTPIRLALLPRLVERAALPSAIGYSAMVFNSSRILGPAVGAWLLTVISVPLVYAAAGLTLGAAALMLLRVRGVAESKPSAERGSFIQQLRAGLRYALTHGSIRLVFLLTLASGLLGRTLIELLPALSGKLLGGDASTLATLSAVAGAGSILGGLLVSRQSGRLARLAHLVLGALAVAALLLLSATYWYSLQVLAAAVFGVAMCTTIIGTGCQALTQLMVDERFRGRVMSLWTVIAMGAPAVGTLLVGIGADHLGFPASLALTALLALSVLLRVGPRLLGRIPGHSALRS